MKNISFLVLSCCVFVGCTKDPAVSPPPTNRWNVKFQLSVSNEPLAKSITKKYVSPAADTFTISQFKCYISNIKLISSNSAKNYIQKDSYHLINYDNGNIIKDSFSLVDVPSVSYDSVQLSIGIDSVANSKFERVGDLDPNSNMAWDWEIGNKFVLLEGTFSTASPKKGDLVVHIGQNSNFKTKTIAITKAMVDSHRLVFKLDVNQMFGAPNIIDFDRTNDIMSGLNARKVAENYATNLITISEIGK